MLTISSDTVVIIDSEIFPSQIITGQSFDLNCVFNFLECCHYR